MSAKHVRNRQKRKKWQSRYEPVKVKSGGFGDIGSRCENVLAKLSNKTRSSAGLSICAL